MDTLQVVLLAHVTVVSTPSPPPPHSHAHIHTHTHTHIHTHTRAHTHTHTHTHTHKPMHTLSHTRTHIYLKHRGRERSSFTGVGGVDVLKGHTAGSAAGTGGYGQLLGLCLLLVQQHRLGRQGQGHLQVMNRSEVHLSLRSRSTAGHSSKGHLHVMEKVKG